MDFRTSYNYKRRKLPLYTFESDLKVLDCDTSISKDNIQAAQPLDPSSFTNSAHPTKFFTDLQNTVINPDIVSKVVGHDYNAPSDTPITNPVSN